MAGQFPKPLIDTDSRPYWEGLERQELRIQQCDDCHRHIFYPRLLCPHCFSDHVSWTQASGRGQIYSFRVVHKAFGPFAEQAPFVVAIVELEEGVRMMTRIVGERETIQIGASVQVLYEKVEEDLVLPYFEVIRT